MSRLSPRILASFGLVSLCIALAPAIARAQGVLINVNPEEHVILPRPIVVYPPYYPHPRPQPVPIPESTYKIKELEVNVGLKEQVAKVQVSQSFVNTGSRPMEVS
jgi:Ca-activated chloride channel homolog